MRHVLSPTPGSPDEFSLARLRQAQDPTVLLTAVGRVVFLNPAARRALGPGAVDRGTEWWELWHPRERLRLAGALRDACAGRAVRMGVAPADGGADWDLVILPIEDGHIAGDGLLAAVARPPTAPSEAVMTGALAS